MTSWEKGRGNSCAKPFGPDELEGLVWMGQYGGREKTWKGNKGWQALCAVRTELAHRVFSVPE